MPKTNTMKTLKTLLIAAATLALAMTVGAASLYLIGRGTLEILGIVHRWIS